MLTRSQWKKMRGTVQPGLPPGYRVSCDCGKLVIVEQKLSEVIIHHEVPYCTAFRGVVGEAEFLTVHKADAAQVATAMKAAKVAV